ncbi:MAG: glycine zipper family protein, partial [Mangrovicoccus sp.]|nr:glycine zipper family protein [Mangrovicoccus sp.]
MAYRLSIAAMLPAMALVSACAGTGADYVPITDGAPSMSFQSDLSACQMVAKQRPLVDGQTREDALIGAGLGVLAGLADEEASTLEGALAGAVIGGAAGGSAGALERREDRAEIVVECM